MDNSIILFDSRSELINPSDSSFQKRELLEISLKENINIDSELNTIVNLNLIKKSYINIIIPLCFGSVLSDFLGLRLATHIRCTSGPNQNANIHLYSFANLKEYITNECLNIIKTTGVFLIDYDVNSILQSYTITETLLTTDNINGEVSKLKLDIPLNYEDSHSISNEWAIYRWSKLLKANNKDITDISNKLQSELYFKYQQTINPVNELDSITDDELIIKHLGESTILFIDDQQHKGWTEIFEELMLSRNNIDFMSLDIEFKKLTKTEIIDRSLKMIQDENVDVLMLDLRLHSDDILQKNIKEITGYKILQKVKELNSGIQVIIFSATNQILNLQALTEAKADYFFPKGGISENSIDLRNRLLKLINTLSNCIDQSKWLKPKIISANESYLTLRTKERKKKINKELSRAISNFLSLAVDNLKSRDLDNKLDGAFIYCFLILEALETQLINEKDYIKVKFQDINGKVKDGYKFYFRGSEIFLKEFEYNSFTKTKIGGDLISTSNRIPHKQKIQNIIYNANIQQIDPTKLVKIRNSFIHPNLIENKKTIQIGRTNFQEIFDICISLIKEI